MLCQHQRFGDKLPTGLVQISWELSYQMSLVQFCEIFSFRPPNDVQVQYGSVFSLVMSRESKILVA